jgi:anti-sigma regulatory factor (Ser/Thr protein kinase)
MTTRTEASEDAFTVRLPFERDAARTARDLVDDLLVRHSAAPEMRQDAALVVHELVINAVIHGAPVRDDDGIELSGRVEDSHLHLSVLDGGHDGRVAAKPPSLDAPNGRGLAIVEAICASWNVDRSTGTLVSATLSL